MVFLPRDPQSRLLCEELFHGRLSNVADRKSSDGRDVPTNNSEIGNSAKAVEPVFRQVFIEAAPEV
jgi:glutamate synthase domain-containing protein 1